MHAGIVKADLERAQAHRVEARVLGEIVMIAPGPPAAAVKRGARQTQAPGEAMELLVAVGEQVAPHTSAPLEHQLVHIDGHGADRDMTRAFLASRLGGTRAAAVRTRALPQRTVTATRSL